MKIVLAPDSFKGTLSSHDIIRIAGERLREAIPDCECVPVPIADGGEGTVDAFLTACGGERRTVTVSGPLRGRVEAEYGLLRDGTAVVEMAAAAGLPLVGDTPDPGAATTYGVGELLLDAVSRGARRILLGLGGSATNDAGCGAAVACGAVFRDASGRKFVPTGSTLREVSSVDVSGLRKFFDGISVTVLCDITNPFYGETGAAYVFAPQKGASPKQVLRLDAGLRHLADVLRNCLGTDVQSIPGSGAAGGMGGGMAAFFGAPLKPGVETLLDTARFNAALADADAVITGEGRLDSQSLGGKVVSGILGRARLAGVPVVALVGSSRFSETEARAAGFSAVFCAHPEPAAMDELRRTCESDLLAAVDRIVEELLRH